MNPSQESKETLKNLFYSIGWGKAFEDAMASECRNAYLHGLADAAYEDEIEENEEGTRYFWRGRLFSLRDYQLAKEAIAALGADKFALNFEREFGRLPPINSHLFDE